ncbi:MAG: hypothetical protein ACK5JJ_08130 [Cyanobacteriota bacterium]|jgi:hypothetical protein
MSEQIKAAKRSQRNKIVSFMTGTLTIIASGGASGAVDPVLAAKVGLLGGILNLAVNNFWKK